MDTFFNPKSIAIIGLSSRENNLSRLILGNLLRWGYRGRLFGVNPTLKESNVDGIKMYHNIGQLPETVDLAVALLPARFLPGVVEECGKAGVRNLAIPSGGFNEADEKGARLAEELLAKARKHQVRFIGPNGLTIANTANGLCLPFPPLYPPPKGGMSIITQSGGVGIFLWNLMADENVGLAKFASIGNKLDLNEVDFLHYFAQDPETEIICLYVESIANGRALLEAAENCDKPILLYKSNTTNAGKRAAMSHTAAISNNDDVLDAALERAGIIRLESFHDFISVTKAFRLPPMRGNRLMAMSPAGGFSVILADLCDKAGFEFADPGREFYEQLSQYGNARVINLSNPLDMGDMYDPKSTGDIFYSVLHNDNVDGAIYVNQWPRMPIGDDIFSKMFHTDISQETMGAVRSSGKPLGVCLFGQSVTVAKIKNNISLPIFNSPEELVRTMKIQQTFYANQAKPVFCPTQPEGIDIDKARRWVSSHQGVIGEELFELLALFGINIPAVKFAATADEAVSAAQTIGYPVVLKVVSPDAIHKSEAGGVMVDIGSDEEVSAAFSAIRSNLEKYNKEARFQGVRVMQMAPPGQDMFIGGHVDDSFGPVTVFGYGGIYVEVFNDTERALCPTSREEVQQKTDKLKCARILAGTRGQQAADLAAYIDTILRISWLMAEFPEIQELDLNPVRVLSNGNGAIALDGRARIISRPVSTRGV